jgi:divalent metal cation (Fe/Co/Zn/Cd) transporter
VAEAEPTVQQVNDVIAIHLGPHHVLVNVSIDFRDDVPAGRVEQALTRIEAAVKARFAEVSRVFTEVRAGPADGGFRIAGRPGMMAPGGAEERE